jgi:SAM-dependent methyltransferase
MVQSTSEPNADEFYAQTYDDSVPDWPGEIDFYRALAAKVKSFGGAVLEVACGTGRVAIRLAQDGVNVVGLDLSPEMIEVATRKSAGLGTVRWVEADMRSFQLQEVFNLALIPGHAFQNLNHSQDQAACLECIRHHLSPGGSLVVHLDHMNLENMRWLGDLCGVKRGVFEAAEQFQHPQSGRQTRATRAWSYEPSTQTAIVRTTWEEVDTAGQILSRIEREPIQLHCVFRFEMEHLLARVGFVPEAVYGDFFRHELRDDSPGMIWVARSP